MLCDTSFCTGEERHNGCHPIGVVSVANARSDMHFKASPLANAAIYHLRPYPPLQLSQDHTRAKAKAAARRKRAAECCQSS